MNVNEVRKKAIAAGIHPEKKPKGALIREIQLAEGNTPCFDSNDGGCPHVDCCWMGDCHGASAPGR